MTDDANPYLNPDADTNGFDNSGSAGGTLETGIAGNYDFEILAVIKEAWEKTYGMKGPFWGAATIIGLGLMVFMSVLSGILGIAVLSGNAVGGMGLSLVLQLTITALLYPLWPASSCLASADPSICPSHILRRLAILEKRCHWLSPPC